MKFHFRKTIFPNINLLNLLIEATCLSIVFLVPLWFAYFFPTFNIFELNKIILFKVLTLVLLFLVSFKIIINWSEFYGVFLKAEGFLKILKKHFLYPALFLTSLIVSFCFSSNYAVSFFGDYNRQQGLLNYFFYFGFFILLILSFFAAAIGPEKKQGFSYKTRIRRLIKSAVFSGFLVSTYGILQILGIDFFAWPESPLLSGRIISSFGQPNFLASFLLFVLPLSLYLLISCKKFLAKFACLLIGFSELVCLLLTSSRGAIIALSLTIALFCLGLLFSKSSRRKKIISLAVALGFLSALFIGLETFMPGRVINMANYRSGSFATRLDFFSAAADSIIKKPVFGYGLENEGDVFIKYYNKDWAINGDVGANTDRAHNLLLDTLLTSGLIGLCGLLFLYFWFFKLLEKNIKENKNRELSLALMFGALAYLLSLLVGFSTVGTEIYFWFFLALAALINISPLFSVDAPFLNKEKIKKITITKIFYISVLSLFCIWQVISNFRILKADYYFNKVYIALTDKEYGSALVLSEDIRNLKINYPQQNYYDNFLANNLSDIYNNISELATQKLVKNELERVYPALGNSYKDLLLKAKIATTLGDRNLASNHFQLLKTITPYWPNLYLEEAMFFFRISNFDSAKKAYFDAEACLPDLDNPTLLERINFEHETQIRFSRYLIYRNLGDIYFQEKEYKSAEHYYSKAYNNYLIDYSLFKKIADTYYLRGDLKTAILFNERGAIRNPLDYNWTMALAELYRESGELEKAKFYFNRALQLAPSNIDLTKFKASFKD